MLRLFHLIIKMNATFARSLTTVQEEIQSLSVEEDTVTSYLQFVNESQNEFMCEHLHSRVNDEKRVQSVSETTTENVSVFFEDVSPTDEPDFESESVVEPLNSNENDIEDRGEQNQYASADETFNFTQASDQQFGNIVIQNTNEVVFGSKTVYNGPVIIRHAMATPKRAEQSETETNDNDVKDADTLNLSGEYRPLNFIFKNCHDYSRFFEKPLRSQENYERENNFIFTVVTTETGGSSSTDTTITFGNTL